MSNYSSPNVDYLLVGPNNLTALSKKFGFKVSDQAVDTTPFGVTDAQFEKPGVTRTEVTGHEGWFDDTAYAAASQMVALTDGEKVLMLALQGNTAGLKAECTGGLLHAGLEHGMTVGDFTSASMELVVSGTMDEATIVAALAQVSGNGNTEASYVDLGAAGGGTTGGNAYMSCTQLALTGSTNIVITLEDSADHVTWADHTVFTALTAVGAEKKAATDLTVNRYVAVKRVFTGLAGSPTATFTVAVKVNDPH